MKRKCQSGKATLLSPVRIFTLIDSPEHSGRQECRPSYFILNHAGVNVFPAASRNCCDPGLNWNLPAGSAAAHYWRIQRIREFEPLTGRQECSPSIPTLTLNPARA